MTGSAPSQVMGRMRRVLQDLLTVLLSSATTCRLPTSYAVGCSACHAIAPAQHGGGVGGAGCRWMKQQRTLRRIQPLDEERHV